MHLGNLKTSLGADEVARAGWATFGGLQKVAPHENWTKSITVGSGTYEPDKIAFQLIRELYVWFGHSEDEIPYTKNANDARVIDVDKIIGIR
jgi:hypothetical protein